MRLISFLFLLIISSSLLSQNIEYLIIDNIDIVGNQKTSTRVIQYELDYQIGDTIILKQINQVKEFNEKRLLGTALFTDVKTNITNWDTETGRADLKINVRENWYLYPTIILEFADRSFNVWFFDQNRDLSRINYGLGVKHINLTGHKDKLTFKFQRGYTNKFEVEYAFPYLYDRLGLKTSFFKADYDEIGYATIENKTAFYHTEPKRKLLDRMRIGLGFSLRTNAQLSHKLDIQYHHNNIDDLVSNEVNPEYFGMGRSNLQMMSAQYQLTYDNRLFNFYPEGGWFTELTLLKEGVGIFDDYSNTTLQLELQKYHRFSDRISAGVRIKGSTKFENSNIPFANNTALGYDDDLVRGYELYVVDGSDWILGKSSLRFAILSSSYNLGKFMTIQQFRIVPIDIYIRGNLEIGYVNEERFLETNALNNTWLTGYGPGIDLIFYHTFLFSVEYNFNFQGDNKLYLKSTFNF